MRAFLCGILAGLTLSWLRIDGALGPLDLALPPAGEAALVRALALLALGLAYLRREPAPRGAEASTAPSFGPRGAARLAAGATVGFAAHAFGLADVLAPASLLGAVGIALLALVVLRLASGGPSGERAPRPGARAWSATLGPLELLALVGLGAVLAMALEALARWGRLLTPPGRETDALLALAWLALTALGAASFGRLVAAPRRRAALAPALLAAAVAGTLVGWRVIGNLAHPRGLERYFRHPLLELSGLDPSAHGTLGYGLALGASLLIVPALLAGAGLAALDSRARLGALLCGGGLGLVVLPRLFAADGLGGRTSPGLIEPLMLAAAGCAAAALLARRLPAGARLLGLAAASPVALLALRAWPAPHPPVDPWRQRAGSVDRVLELPAGVLALGTGGELRVAALDGRWIAPEAEERAAEEAALAVSLALAPRTAEGLRVLFVGALTPERADQLLAAGATRIDRSASFSAALETIEGALFGSLPPPPGDRLDPGQALDRWRAGSYALVVAPPVAGARGPAAEAFARSAAEAPATAATAWLDPSTPLAGDALGPRLVFAQSRLEDWRLAVARLADGGPQPEHPPLVLDAGLPAAGSRPLTRLLERGEERAHRARTALARRLARANTAGEAGAFCEGLAAFAAAQTRSSPFEAEAERVELPEAALGAWTRAAQAQPGSSTVRALLEEVASTLADKRAIDALLALAPLVESRGPWPALERALAYGELEALLPGPAAERLERVVRESPADGGSHAWLGEALRMLGRHEEAAAAYGRALELLPGRPRLEEALAIELTRIGDPEGRRRLESLLAEDPEREALAAWLEPGPREAPEPGLRPDLLRKGHEEH